MYWIMENHLFDLFVGLFDWGNAETKTFSVSRNWDGFTLAESQTRKSGTPQNRTPNYKFVNF